MKSIVRLQGKIREIEEALSNIRYEKTLSDYSNRNKQWFDKQEIHLLSKLSMLEDDLETAMMGLDFKRLA